MPPGLQKPLSRVQRFQYYYCISRSTFNWRKAGDRRRMPPLFWKHRSRARRFQYYYCMKTPVPLYYVIDIQSADRPAIDAECRRCSENTGPGPGDSNTTTVSCINRWQSIQSAASIAKTPIRDHNSTTASRLEWDTNTHRRGWFGTFGICFRQQTKMLQ